jgi:hypothetical protein
MCWICPWVQTWSCNSESNIGWSYWEKDADGT